uniref:Uncharacterized protein n=1 Tax=Arundo donax TaxID=35708 RepID=A0A0A9HKW8_ARUDO
MSYVTGSSVHINYPSEKKIIVTTRKSIETKGTSQQPLSDMYQKYTN